MEYILCMLAGGALLAAGFFLGARAGIYTVDGKPEEPKSEAADKEAQRLLRERQKQWDSMMSYTGRRGKNEDT